MNRLALTCAATASTLALAGCYDRDEANYADNGYNAAADNAAYGTGGNATGYAAGGWPEGARIVVEEGVTYRIDPGGARVALGPADSRVEVVDGVRFRVDPSGERVRIDDQGATISVGPAADTGVTGNATVTVNQQ